MTGRGHGTDKAVLLGFEGEHGRTRSIRTRFPDARAHSHTHRLRARQARDRVRRKARPGLQQAPEAAVPHQRHALLAYDADGNELATRDYYSVGGGFVVNHDEAAEDRIVADTTEQPYPFSTGDQMLALCKKHGLTIAQLMMANEKVWRSEAESAPAC
jgi:L-serine dehydratase